MAGVSTRAVRAAALAGLGAGLLFVAYLRVSWTVPVTADGAAQALQARDMLAGNWLLHGWTVSDVSFYTTELPEYVLVELARPFGAGVIHVAAAASYTLLVLATWALARGAGRGTWGLVGGTLAAGIMLAPQLGYGAFVLLLSPDHTATQLPLQLGWLLVDWWISSRARTTALVPRVQRGWWSWWSWWVPVALCLLLAWVQLADRVALVTTVLPLVLVCGIRLIRSAVRSRPPLPISSDHPDPLPISSDHLNHDKTVSEMVVTDRKCEPAGPRAEEWEQRGRPGWRPVSASRPAGIGLAASPSRSGM